MYAVRYGDGMKRLAGRISRWLRETLADDSPAPDPAVGSGPDEETGMDGEGADEPRSNLFRCPECDTIYIATGTRHCSRCDVEIVEVT